MDDSPLDFTDNTQIQLSNSELKSAVEGCLQFSDYQEVAAQIVNDVLESAVIKLNESHDVVDETKKLSMAGNITWPTVESFTPQSAVRSLTDFIYYSAELPPDWMYVIKQLPTTTDRLSDFYKYEVMFSLPTRCYPVPQVTASLFFTFEVSKAIDASCPARVTFKAEGSSRVLTPGRHVIDEGMLLRMMESKIRSFRRYRW